MSTPVRTLQECITLFNLASSNKEYAVRQMENISEWETAAKYWKILGRQIDTEACLLIHNSIQIGNAYRAEVKDLTEWADTTIASGIMTAEECGKIIYPKLLEAHNKYYRHGR